MEGYVLGPAEGERIVHFRNPGNLFIKADPLKGSKNLAIGTQQVPVGAGIPIHIHFEADEAFYILEGSGSFILNDAPLPFEIVRFHASLRLISPRGVRIVFARTLVTMTSRSSPNSTQLENNHVRDSSKVGRQRSQGRGAGRRA